MPWILVDVSSQLFFRLFPIRQAALAGPRPAHEWKSLAHVIFGKCRVHRNPEAWSPVSARHPRLTFTKQKWMVCAVDELKKGIVNSAMVGNYQRAIYTVVAERKHFLPSWLLK